MTEAHLTVQEARQKLVRELVEWKDAAAPPECVADAIEGLIYRVRAKTCFEFALDNLLDAVGGVLAYDYCDCDCDVVKAMERLQKAAEDYGTVQRLST
jgi:hypothetical protein